MHRKILLVALAAMALAAMALAATPVNAQRFTIEQVLAPAFPYELVAARRADRIAWVEFERGIRNVYTALAPGFEPVRVTAFDADDGVDLTGLQISDDGTVLTFIRGHERNGDGWVANPASDPSGGVREVWAAGTTGRRPWRVAEADEYALSPDGRWIAYMHDGQVHRAAVNPGVVGGRAALDSERVTPLFRAYGTISNPMWSPDSRRIAFVSSRTDHAYIGVYDMADPRVTYMAPGVDRDGSVAWSPDARQVVFQRRPGDPFAVIAARSSTTASNATSDTRIRGTVPGITQARFRGGHSFELWVADATTGEGYAIWRNAPDDTRFAQMRNMQWADEHIVFQAEPGEWRHWYSLPVTRRMNDSRSSIETASLVSLSPTELTPGDGFVEYATLSADGRYLVYAANIGDLERRDVWRVRTSGGAAERVTRGDAVETQPVMLPSGRHIALLYADAKHPLSVAVVDANGGTPRVITPLPSDFPLGAHIVPQELLLTSSDSVVSHNQLFLPPDMKRGEKRPALVFVHGGPQRQMMPAYHYMHFYHMAYAMNQYFANKGYIVLSVNYRSGIGYGRSFRTAANVGRRGMSEYADILAAGRYLQQRADVDTARIGIWGLSYGGILTAQALARNSDIFKAGVDLAGVHSWGDPLDTAAVTYRSSAVSHIAGWKSPVLLIHGDDDRNVSFSQTVGLVQALRALDVPYELIVYPDDVHDSLLFSRWLQSFRATDDFFERTLIRREKIPL